MCMHLLSINAQAEDKKLIRLWRFLEHLGVYNQYEHELSESVLMVTFYALIYMFIYWKLIINSCILIYWQLLTLLQAYFRQNAVIFYWSVIFALSLTNQCSLFSQNILLRCKIKITWHYCPSQKINIYN